MSDKNVDLEFEALLRASAQVAADYDSNLLADISTPDIVTGKQDRVGRTSGGSVMALAVLQSSYVRNR